MQYHASVTYSINVDSEVIDSLSSRNLLSLIIFFKVWNSVVLIEFS